MNNALGFIRLSSYSQVKPETIAYHKDIIANLCKVNKLKLIDFLELKAKSGRKEDSIENYMKLLKWQIKNKNINYLVSTELRNFGRLAVETGWHLKDIIQQFNIIKIITKDYIIDSNTFKLPKQRMELNFRLIMCEMEGYNVVDRTTDAKK